MRAVCSSGAKGSTTPTEFKIIQIATPAVDIFLDDLESFQRHLTS